MRISSPFQGKEFNGLPYTNYQYYGTDGWLGISRACGHLLKYVSLGLTFPIAHCYNIRQYTAAIAAMP